MSVYPGNPSLSTAVKNRVSSTFEQTLQLYRSGRMEEVLSGCNLILQMDPVYDPARKLLEKVRNPASPIDVDQLIPAGSSSADALTEARAAMGIRDFERVIQITTEILTNDLMNDDARVLADEAREKLEASPFVDQFVKKCEHHLGTGNMNAARTDLDKARALDPAHPGVKRIEDMISAKSAAAPRADASSFVVETPAGPAGRGTAQASDFGFTFEEEKTAPKPAKEASFANFSFDAPGTKPSTDSPFAGGFSFDTPVTPSSATKQVPGAPSFVPGSPAASGSSIGGEFDFSTASIETTPDDQRKIDQFLADGDRVFDAGDYQGAIDIWSRIFLIDVTNDGASERIERAKLKRRESEQKIEGALAAGVQAYERKDFSTARSRMNEVLQADSMNITAQDYLARIDSGSRPKTAAGTTAVPKPDDSFLALDETPSEFDLPQQPLEEEQGATARPPRKTPAPKSAPTAEAPRRSPMGFIAIALAAVLLLGGGWFLWSKFMSAPKADPAAAQSVLTQAGTLAQRGKFDQAISMLQDIKPGDAQYDAALSMIADLQQRKAKASTLVDGRPAGAFYEESLVTARAAFDAHDYVGAKKAFENAMRVKALPPEVKNQYDTAAQQVGKLDSARALFGERKYQDVIVQLTSLLQQDPKNKNIQRMITDAHFNLGATALQEDRLPDALREFDEVLASEPNDELARRSKELAQRYGSQQKDLLYKIYVKYLPLRQPAA